MASRLQYPSAMAVDEELFRNALGQWPSGVTVVTSIEQGAPTGMTASSFTSVSLRPPLVSVCVDLGARTLAALQASRRFGVSILAADQADISRRFASRMDEALKFQVPTVPGVNGCRLIVGAAVHLECETFAEHPAGDHVLFIGLVTSARVHPAEPLSYCAGHYGNFLPARSV
jgi:flavin reductase (DIM6/NTAB) family NADH-FMN oxidoreductase RutF